MLTPICTLQLACDGDNLALRSRERGYCGKCAQAQAKRQDKAPKALRGENTALYQAQRRTIQKPKVDDWAELPGSAEGVLPWSTASKTQGND